MNCSTLAFINLIRGVYSQKNWVGVCDPHPNTLTLFMTESAIFPALFMTLKSSFFKKTYPVQDKIAKPYDIHDQNGLNWYPIHHQNGRKPYHLWPHIPMPIKGTTPSPNLSHLSVCQCRQNRFLVNHSDSSCTGVYLSSILCNINSFL